MIDWSASMQQTFEYYTVDPGTWMDDRKLNNVISCTITRDSTAETLGYATFDIAESLGECYIRIYLIAIQNGLKEKIPLGTYLVQTPTSGFDGKMTAISVDTYSPLLELKEKMPPIGYYIPKEMNILEYAYLITRENARAPVVKGKCDEKLYADFVANTSDTWLAYLTDLLANAKYKFSLDEMGRILFAPDQDTASLQAIWTFDDSNSSILYPDLTLDHDLYGIPNVVEVVYSDKDEYYHARVVNDDPNSPISTVTRGREIIYREVDPNFIGDPTENQVYERARLLLRELSTLEYTVTYTHGYCPVRLGDCVRLNYSRAKGVGVNGVKAKIISQSIKCEAGCPVTEKAVFTTKLWR